MKNLSSSFKFFPFRVIIFIIYIFINLNAFAQSDAFTSSLNQIGISYKIPGNFYSIGPTDSSFYPDNKNPINSAIYRLESIQNDLVISFSMLLIDTTEFSKNTEKFIKKINPSYDRNDNYIHYIENDADTSVDKVQFYNKELLAKLNADAGGYYNMKLLNNYMNQYNHCKFVFLTKKNRGDIFLYFFYKDGAPILNYLKSTIEMLKFNTHSGNYHPK